jgi:DNA-directed RNA polymerase sigma subunit (sigma70/sigma32)
MFDLCDKPENGEFGWLREALEDPCLKLSDVERSIIVDYFGVGSEDLSRKIRLKDVAAEYGCTHQRIHQIKDRLLVKLRKSVGDIDMACA